MYAILNDDMVICDFEYRDIELDELINCEFHKYYISISDSNNLKVGDIWDSEKKEWVVCDIPEPNITIAPNIPSNTEVAQMISDLQADLIIAGVI